MITSGQIKKVHTLLSKSGLMDQKRSLIEAVTNGRTTSSKQMTFDEAVSLINYLSNDSDATYRMRMKVFFYAYEIGICEHGDVTERKINAAALDAYLVKNSYLHKRLNEYSSAELPKLVNQMAMILKHNLQAEAARAVKGLLTEIDAKRNFDN